MNDAIEQAHEFIAAWGPPEPEWRAMFIEHLAGLLTDVGRAIITSALKDGRA